MEQKNNIQPQDLSELLEQYSNMWVVLSYDETAVLKAGKSYEDIIEYADKGISMFVPDYIYPVAP